MLDGHWQPHRILEFDTAKFADNPNQPHCHSYRFAEVGTPFGALTFIQRASSLSQRENTHFPLL